MISSVEIPLVGGSEWSPLGSMSYAPHILPYYVFLSFESPAYVSTGEGLKQIHACECIIQPPDIPRCIVPKEGTAGFTNSWCFFTGQGIEEEIRQLNLPVNEIFRDIDPARTERIFHMLIDEQMDEKPFSDCARVCALELLLLHAASCCADKPEDGEMLSAYGDSIRKLKRRLAENPAEDWNVARMAAYVGISPSRFHAVYKKVTASSPTKDLMLIRVQTAKRLLTNFSLSQKQVAERAGFSNEYYMSRVFHSMTGLTPGEYRLLSASANVTHAENEDTAR